jgi:hypothetical protein
MNNDVIYIYQTDPILILRTYSAFYLHIYIYIHTYIYQTDLVTILILRTCSAFYLHVCRLSWSSRPHCSCYSIWGHSVRNDGVWVDSCQGLLAPLLYVFYVALVHTLRNGDCRCGTKLQHCIDYLHDILCHLEPLLWVHQPPTGRCHS